MGLIGDWRERRAARDAADRADRLFRDGDRLRLDGREAEAEPLLEEAVRIRTDVLGPAAAATLTSRLSRARVLRQLGRYAAAEAELREIVDHASARPALWKLNGRARLLLGTVLLLTERPQEAVTELDRFLDLAEQHDFGKFPLLAHDQRATAYALLGRDAEAAVQYADLAAAWTAEEGPGSERALRARSSRAVHLVLLGRYEAAETECRDLIRTAAALNSPQASVNWFARSTLAYALVGQGRPAEGEVHVREAIDLHCAAQGPDARTPVSIQLALARSLSAQQRHEEALSTARSIEDAFAGTPGFRPSRLAAISLAIGTAQLGRGRTEEAWQAADRALAHCRTALSPNHHRTLKVGTLRGRIRLAQGRMAEARDELTANAAAWRIHFGGNHPMTRATEQELTALD